MDEQTVRETEAALPSWCSTLFVINIVWLALTLLTSLRTLSGDWRQTVRFTGAPVESFVVNAALTLLLVAVGVVANVLLLNRHRLGVPLGFVVIGLVAASTATQLWGASVGGGLPVVGPMAAWRVAYNGVFLLAILKVKRLLAHTPNG